MASSSTKPGCTSCTRSANSCTASAPTSSSNGVAGSRDGTRSGDSRQMASPSTRSASRLVARTTTSAHEPVMRSTSSAASSITCSQLSSSRSVCFTRSEVRSVSTIGWSILLLHGERFGQRPGHAGRVGHGREVGHEHTVGVLAELAPAELNGEPRLAHATWPEQRDHRVRPRRPHHLGLVLHAADERRAGLRQVRGEESERPHRRERGGPPRLLHLVEADGAGEVAHLVEPEVDGAQVGRHAPGRGERGHRGVAHHQLPAVGGVGHPGGLVHGHGHVVTADRLGLARVDPHAHPQLCAVGPRVRGERALRVDRGGQRVGRVLEGHEERVARGVHLDAAVGGPRRPQEPVVVLEGRAVAVARPAEDHRGGLDVGEQEAHRARRPRCLLVEEGPVVGSDGPLQLDQARAGVEAELVGQHRPGGLERT